MAHSQDTRLRLEAPATPDHVAEVRRAVCDVAAELGLAGEALENVALATTEAVANVVVHAYRHQHDAGTFRVEAFAKSDELVVCVRDEGCGMSPRTDSPGLGLGLPLIARVADRMHIGEVAHNGGGAVVEMGFSLRG